MRGQRYWLKSLGRSNEGQQLPDDWKSVADGLFLRAVTFPQKPNVLPGDGLILYASGTHMCFAAVEASSIPYRRDNSEWPWQVDVTHLATRDTIHQGVPLNSLDVDGREHNVRIRRRSHVNLTRREFDAGVLALN
jgi:hypothetical protein